MPSCIRCGQENALGARVCAACSASIPRFSDPSQDGQGGFSLEEGRSYPIPIGNYRSQYLDYINTAVNAYLDGAPIDDVLNWVGYLRQQYEDFNREEIPKLGVILEGERQAEPDNEVPYQIGYLARKAMSLYADAFAHMDQFLINPEDESPDPALEAFQEATNYLCTFQALSADYKKHLENLQTQATSSES